MSQAIKIILDKKLKEVRRYNYLRYLILLQKRESGDKLWNVLFVKKK
jgi:hypothetical protein